MNDLVIKLTGEVLSSNFEQWKDALVAQIRSTRTELSTDNDFVEAGRRVKLFKTAEATLQAAKESALRQAADIQRLFAAIDEVSEEARQARLALERQIRTRKQQIRDGLIETGIAAVRKMIAAQPEDFQLLDQRDYLDRARFELAVKGKMGTSGVYAAINGLCATIGREIEERSGEVCKNGQLIDSLPDNYRLLFQDRDSLVSLSGPELDLLIQQRIARLNEKQDRDVALEVDVLARRRVALIRTLQKIRANRISRIAQIQNCDGSVFERRRCDGNRAHHPAILRQQPLGNRNHLVAPCGLLTEDTNRIASCFLGGDAT
ncbi:MAG: hypothetical protein IPH83_20785 [Gammaproteobacteria bacterium]|nr:hypothetical protein [Gammaproteobacteria bacterium]